MCNGDDAEADEREQGDEGEHDERIMRARLISLSQVPGQMATCSQIETGSAFQRLHRFPLDALRAPRIVANERLRQIPQQSGGDGDTDALVE